MRTSLLHDLCRLLLNYPKLKRAGFNNLEIRTMRKSKKEEYWGTSVKRFTRDIKLQEVFNIEGIIYINVRDSVDEDKILRIVAHETEHLLDDEPGIEKDAYDYLRRGIPSL